jgi:hypothetical protein
MVTRLIRFALVLALIAAALPEAAAQKKLVLMAGKPSHGKGAHDFNRGCALLKKCLDGFPGLRVETVANGWPQDEKVFQGAAAIALYSDGGGRHPFLQGNRMQVLDGLVKKGVGIGLMHYAVEVPKEKAGPQFQAWIGGYYEHKFSCNPMWAPDYKTFPKHPVNNGVKPFSCKDEWYMHMRFRDGMKGVTPILLAKPSDQVRKGPYVHPKGPYDHIVARSGQDEIMMWCVERADGGRGFGWTGGHYHKNWGDESYRKGVLNALVWLCKLKVPADGVKSTVTEEDLQK